MSQHSQVTVVHLRDSIRALDQVRVEIEAAHGDTVRTVIEATGDGSVQVSTETAGPRG